MKVAVFLYEGCALWQIALLTMILEREACEIRILTLGGTIVHVSGGIRVAPETSVEKAAPRDFELFVTCGGSITRELAEDARLVRFLRQFDGHRGRIAAACTSVSFLGAAGLLGGLSFTTLPSTVEKFPEWFEHTHFTDADVTTSGNVTTAKGHAHVLWTSEVLMQLGFPKTIYHDTVRLLAGCGQAAWQEPFMV